MDWTDCPLCPFCKEMMEYGENVAYTQIWTCPACRAVVLRPSEEADDYWGDEIRIIAAVNY
jgi:ribosomal protein L37AE/L43A